MKYDPCLNTPFRNAGAACLDLRNALYDMADCYSASEDYDSARAMIKAREALLEIEKTLLQYENRNTEALEKELIDAGIL